ncbi:MAG: S-adenosylhomocysteine deaminase (EC; Methylthioadenosine deaminase [uncultured Thiotrichaceae bacterium]|uniref:5-methylthioadenosine/S-adenosylhomocysteine deaminase n=1 Tax=uncultured Thiotrichaceae bacterium TaxID=298394 RepID=A0A6S6SV55_9GAMM|nr:MAG: S-adenosylhomocysteine deaminase (EC; Methylthioadenosine deaminase [uncultured Thiotrichaceae bacterium]
MKIKHLISASWLLTVDQDDRVLKNHAIAIQDGTIIDILPIAAAKQKYQAEQYTHLEQQALLPGLINAHTHAAMSLLKGLADDLPLMEWLEEHIWPAEGQWADADFVYDGTKLAIAEMLRSGTTCFNDMYFFPEAAAKAVEESGIRATLGMILVDFPTAYAQSPDEYFQKGRALNDYCADHPTISTLLAPHAPYTVSDEPLKEAGRLAGELTAPIHMHVHETAFEIMQATENGGERPLSRLNKLGLLDKHFLAVHMTQLQDDEIVLLAEKNTHVIHCPESNMKLASGFCPVAKLLEAGVNVALGTDGNASNNDLDMLGEMRTAALIGKGFSGDATAIPAKQALRMATINGAKALGLDHVTGSLETGKSADLIAMDLSGLESQPLYDPVSHLVYCTSRNQVTHSWVNGRLLMENRQLTTLDSEALVTTAKTWQAKIATFGTHTTPTENGND